MKTNMIQYHWDKFEKAVLSKAPQYQKIQMRDSFYAGVSITLDIIISMNAREGVSKRQAKDTLNNLITECRGYADVAILDSIPTEKMRMM